MTIDLSVLYGGSSSTSSTGTQSALAAFKKLQATAEANQAADSASTTAEKLAAQLRDIDNAGIQPRNAQYKQINAQVESARSEKRRVGKEWISTCKSRVTPEH